MKYIIDVDKDRIDCSGQLFIAVDIPNSQSAYEIPTGMWVKEYTEPDRKAIEDEVWGFLVFLINEMDVDDKYECFNQSSAYKIVSTMSYQEAKAKYEAWKKRNDEIRVGDEVEIVNMIGVVTRVPEHDEQRVHYITKSGTVYCNNAYAEIKKTGRHFDEIEEMLKKMRDTGES